jgi:hypothetical protein
VSDFEIVRRSILTTRTVDGDVEALDRIEAEVERLRRQLDNLLDERGETPYVAEVERLQRSADAWQEEARRYLIEKDEARAEVERLIADNRRAEETNERLRAALGEIANALPQNVRPKFKAIARNALAEEKE